MFHYHDIENNEHNCVALLLSTSARLVPD